MRIGSSIGLIAIGLILALAVDLDVSGIDLTLVGWILAAVGVLGLIASLVLSRRARTVVQRPYVEQQAYVEPQPYVEQQPPPAQRPVVREDRHPRDY